MGYHTLGDFRTRLNLSLGEKRQGNERLDFWINDAVFELPTLPHVKLDSMKECVTTETVKDQESYAFPADFYAMISVADTENGNRLLYLALENFQLKKRVNHSGTPKYWSQRENALLLWPTPNGIYDLELFYWKEPARLLLEADTTPFPSVYDRAVHLLSVRNALMDLGMRDDATFTFQTAMNYVRTIMSPDDMEANAPQKGVEIARSEADLTRIRS